VRGEEYLIAGMIGQVPDRKQPRDVGALGRPRGCEDEQVVELAGCYPFELLNYGEMVFCRPEAALLGVRRERGAQTLASQLALRSSAQGGRGDVAVYFYPFRHLRNTNSICSLSLTWCLPYVEMRRQAIAPANNISRGPLHVQQMAARPQLECAPAARR
jgi:hypothetical protein